MVVVLLVLVRGAGCLGAVTGRTAARGGVTLGGLEWRRDVVAADDLGAQVRLVDVAVGGAAVAVARAWNGVDVVVVLG